MELHEQGVFAQASAQEERVDVMSCPSHGLQNVPRAELKPEKKRHMKERERERGVYKHETRHSPLSLWPSGDVRKKKQRRWNRQWAQEEVLNAM